MRNSITRQLAVECLESRILLTATLTDGLLEISGTAQADTIEVALVAAHLNVTVNGEQSTYAADEVNQIMVTGDAGNDTVTLAGNVGIGALIEGGDGDDYIVGGGGNDEINGGDGDDTINGGEGRDRITGGSGGDVIYGGTGRDFLFGNGGNDLLVGGDGNDRLRGGRGNNEIIQDGENDIVADVQGSMYVENALVHFVKAERSNGQTLVLIPGRNLSSSIFLATPDGREGWAQMFADDGYDVYIINDPNFDFSGGFHVEGFEDVPREGAPPADPGAERAWQRDVWSRWGFGESEGNPYPDTRFPTDDFDTFEANYPYVSSAGRSYSDAVVALLEMVGPATVMAHSAGASVAVNVATERPDLVTGFVMVEPAGPPEASDFPALAGMSMLGVYGDYIDSRNQGGRKEATEEAAELFIENGGVGEVISLPEDHEIYGNTHLMMQDDNNAFIADLIADWLNNQVT